MALNWNLDKKIGELFIKQGNLHLTLYASCDMIYLPLSYGIRKQTHAVYTGGVMTYFQESM